MPGLKALAQSTFYNWLLQSSDHLTQIGKEDKYWARQAKTGYCRDPTPLNNAFTFVAELVPLRFDSTSDLLPVCCLAVAALELHLPLTDTTTTIARRCCDETRDIKQYPQSFSLVCRGSNAINYPSHSAFPQIAKLISTNVLFFSSFTEAIQLGSLLNL